MRQGKVWRREPRRHCRGKFGEAVKRIYVTVEAIDMQQKIIKSERSDEIEKVTATHIHLPKDPPEMVLVCGPCRTGTTALGNVFASLGLVSYMQPIKSMRRAVEEGASIVDWTIDSGLGTVFSKETIGAKTEAEFFDPVEKLLELGYPANKIHLIGEFRDPRATLGSWVSMWGAIPLEGFVESFRLTDRMMKNAKARGVKTTHYVMEATATNDADLVLKRLINRTPVSVGVNDHPADWTKNPVFGESGSKVVFFDQPPERFVAGVKESTSYHYKLLLADLTREQDDALRRSGVYDLYRDFTKACEIDLGISIIEE